jgi:hypothetical protein
MFFVTQTQVDIILLELAKGRNHEKKVLLGLEPKPYPCKKNLEPRSGYVCRNVNK